MKSAYFRALLSAAAFGSRSETLAASSGNPSSQPIYDKREPNLDTSNTFCIRGNGLELIGPKVV